MRLRTDEAEFSLAIIIVLLLAYLTDLIGFTCVLGAFIAGTLVARTPFANTKSFSDRMKVLSMGLFIPLFFAWFGLGINIAEIFKYAALAVTVFFAYTALRFTITYVFAKHYRFRVPLLISTSMLSVDVESVIVLLIALKLGIFKDSLPLTIFAPSVFLSTLLIVILVAILSRKEKIGGTKSQNKEIKDSRLAKGSKVSR
jgi:Kef-type K+ transport system membrane component KefB